MTKYVNNTYRDMMEHPDNYSDEQIEAMMNDIDRDVDVDAKWKEFEAKHRKVTRKSVKHVRLWRNVAAVVVGAMLFGAGMFANSNGVKKVFVNKNVPEIAPYEVRDFPKITAEQYNYADSLEGELVKLYDKKYPTLHEMYGRSCSWYCNSERILGVTASSQLPSEGKFDYVAKKVDDFDLNTAWVEGADGYGEGEYLEFSFDPQCWKFDEIHIINGYAKTQKAWDENSRVKKLKVYYNDNPIAVLNLDDVRGEQLFKVGLVGPKNPKNGVNWRVRFEILEVYPGTKYEDTAMTEILFSGPVMH